MTAVVCRTCRMVLDSLPGVCPACGGTTFGSSADAPDPAALPPLNELGSARVHPDGWPGCVDCGRRYGDPGFPDLVIENDAWRAISPNHDTGGLLCPSCICARLEIAGIECQGGFLSGPLCNPDPIYTIRQAENRAEAAEAAVAALVEALELARNRLQRRALDFPMVSAERYETTEWADEATAALAAYRKARR